MSDLQSPHAPPISPCSSERTGALDQGMAPNSSRAIAARLARSALATLILACGFVPGAQGASWYTVEMIVFERIGDANLDDEVWLADPGRPPIEESVEIDRASGLALAEELGEGGAAAPYAFRPLNRSQFRLGGVFSRLRDSRDYRPLLHIAWHQPGYSSRQAKHAHIQGYRDAQSEAATSSFTLEAWPVIDGTVQLYRRRFLHLRADLLYYRSDPREGVESLATTGVLPSAAATSEETQEGSAGTAGQTSSSGSEAGGEVTVSALPGGSSLAATAAADSSLALESEFAPDPRTTGEHRGVADAGPPPVFRMTTSRRMRPGELHYLDHPLFGVLVIVTRYAPASG